MRKIQQVRRIDTSTDDSGGQAMNLIDRVAELRKLEAKAMAEENSTEEYTWCKYSDELRDAAPEMLSILCEIQPDDSDQLRIAMHALQVADIHLDIQRWKTCMETLRRYQAMAAKMTDESK
jgi:hypothetical protein